MKSTAAAPTLCLAGLTAVLWLGGCAGSGSSGTSSRERRPDAPAVDYSTWPLARDEVAVNGPDCANPTPPQSMFRLLTPRAAERHGFGIVDGFDRAPTSAADAPAACPFTPDARLTDALPMAMQMFLAKPTARTAYSAYSACMAQRGFRGVDTPEKAELLVYDRYDAMINSGRRAISEERALRLSPPVKAFEVEDAVASAACQAKAIAPHAKALIRDQNEVIDSAPPKIRKVLR